MVGVLDMMVLVVLYEESVGVDLVSVEVSIDSWAVVAPGAMVCSAVVESLKVEDGKSVVTRRVDDKGSDVVLLNISGCVFAVEAVLLVGEVGSVCCVVVEAVSAITDVPVRCVIVVEECSADSVMAREAVADVSVGIVVEFEIASVPMIAVSTNITVSGKTIKTDR